MNKMTKKALIVAFIAGFLVFCDGIIANILKYDASFTWVAFVSWTVFYGVTIKERFKAVLGYVLGFLSAVLIMKLGVFLEFLNITILGVALSSILATMIINFGCIKLENLTKFVPISINGIFVGISMTFSGVGIGLGIDSLQSSLMLLLIIIIYGILGLICGFLSLKYAET